MKIAIVRKDEGPRKFNAFDNARITQSPTLLLNGFGL